MTKAGKSRGLLALRHHPGSRAPTWEGGAMSQTRKCLIRRASAGVNVPLRSRRAIPDRLCLSKASIVSSMLRRTWSRGIRTLRWQLRGGMENANCAFQSAPRFIPLARRQAAKNVYRFC